MMERPIIFSSEMVRAILEGRKTQTRRVIKDATGAFWDHIGYRPEVYNDGRVFWREVDTQHIVDYAPNPRCPYGKPGDLLWVRETWIPDPPQDDTWDYYDFHDGVLYNFDNLPISFMNPEHVIYRASWDGVDLRWRPSIFMPRWASRITLEITGVRVERVRDISQSDAKAEGSEPWFVAGDGRKEFNGYTEFSIEHCPEEKKNYVTGYSVLWDQINAKRGYSWASNPWVWVIEFKPAQVPGEVME